MFLYIIECESYVNKTTIRRFKPKSFIAGHRANFVFKSGLGRIATANLLLHLLTKYENAGIDSDCIEYN